MQSYVDYKARIRAAARGVDAIDLCEAIRQNSTLPSYKALEASAQRESQNRPRSKVSE